MLKDIISYVQTRAGNASRAKIIEEVNNAWGEIWNQFDLPGSKKMMYVSDCCLDSACQERVVTLPYFVQQLRAAKVYNGPRVQLLQPAAEFLDGKWVQNTLEWVSMGESPLEILQFNRVAPVLRLHKKQAEPIKVVIIGSTRNRDKVREEIVFQPNQLEVEATVPFISYDSITKDTLTESNITGHVGDERVFTLPNASFFARNTVWRTRANLQYGIVIPVSCCYQILYKTVAPYLFYDEDTVPSMYEMVLKDQTTARVLMTEKGNEELAMTYAQSAAGQLSQRADSDTKGAAPVIDTGRNGFTRVYNGYL